MVSSGFFKYLAFETLFLQENRTVPSTKPKAVSSEWWGNSGQTAQEWKGEEAFLNPGFQTSQVISNSFLCQEEEIEKWLTFV